MFRPLVEPLRFYNAKYRNYLMKLFPYFCPLREGDLLCEKLLYLLLSHSDSYIFSANYFSRRAEYHKINIKVHVCRECPSGKKKEFFSSCKDCSGAVVSLQIIPWASRIIPMKKKMVNGKNLAFHTIHKYRDTTMIEIVVLSVL